jgi:two-component system nitrate/nitrite response regulator NarL
MEICARSKGTNIVMALMAHDTTQNDAVAGTGQPTCIVADDHDVVRQGIRLQLDRDGWTRVVAEATSGDQTLDLLRRLRPDLALVDLRLPAIDGIEVARVARTEGLPTRIVIFSAFGGEPLVNRALQQGAHGYVSKGAPASVLLSALQTVHAGGRFLDPGATLSGNGKSVQPLTRREQEILKMMSLGMHNAPIANALDIAPETVKTHVSNILTKLGAASRTEAVAIALRLGIIE